MYVNKSNKLSKSDRFTIVRLWNLNWKLSRITKRFSISRQTVYAILKKYEKHGVDALCDHKTGVLPQPVHSKFYEKVVAVRKKHSWGAGMIEKHFRKKGYKVGHNKINQVLNQEGLINTKMGKQKRPKYIRYEADQVNDQWHMDWSIDPKSKKYLLAIIDDKSRFIVFAGLFDSASAVNTARGYREAIQRYGAPKEMVTDNGAHFKNIKNKTPNEEIQKICDEFKIKHIFIRPYYPQSNGKIERFFGSYKQTFPKMNHPDVTGCLSWVVYYNNERPHQSLDYETPATVYHKCKLNMG
jgi:putative transposase